MLRRDFLKSTAGGVALGLGASLALPAWARSGHHGLQARKGIHTLNGSEFDLNISEFPLHINGRKTTVTGVNQSLPAPLIRFTEGEQVTLRVHNRLDVDTSIHWHGLLVPFQMDGVPGVTFPGIKPRETFTYQFSVPQSGTYWYHSHSGLQEQVGCYGPLIIDPKEGETLKYDREYVLVLGDWTYMPAERLFRVLKNNAESMNFQKRTMRDFARDAGKDGLNKAFKQRAMWGAMRMSPRDLADVGGQTYTYIVNGHSSADNFTMLFAQGERIRLRIINASAMTIFNVRMPDMPMTIVQADGLAVQPLEVDEFQMGVAETYDVIVQPKTNQAHAFVAESIDRSGQVVATLAPKMGMRAAEPALRPVPLLTMKDMGMDHGSMGHGDMDHSKMDHSKMDHSKMDHSKMDHSKMDHSKMHHAGHAGMKPDPWGASVQAPKREANIQRGSGVVNIAQMPVSRLDEPGIGLDNMPHRVLRYSQLRSLHPNPGQRPYDREYVIHLTSNMERYMWSFDGVRFSEVTEAIKFYQGERIRLTLINDTMMPHPIHLHGMFFELVNGGQNHRPRKHTVIVKPGEKLSVDINIEHLGDWAFHCHLLYHMMSGMMQVVSVLPASENPHRQRVSKPATGAPDNHDHHQHHAGGDA